MADEAETIATRREKLIDFSRRTRTVVSTNTASQRTRRGPARRQLEQLPELLSNWFSMRFC